MTDQFRRAIEIVGGPAKMAAVLDVSTQAVCFWRDGKRRLPPELCASIERATSGLVSRRDLRPDDFLKIWPELAPAAAAPLSSVEATPLALVDRREHDIPIAFEDRRVRPSAEGA